MNPRSWASHPTAEISKHQHAWIKRWEGIITTNSIKGRRKGWHDKDLNVEFMGIFNLKKRSEVKNRLFKLEQAGENICFSLLPSWSEVWWGEGDS